MHLSNLCWGGGGVAAQLHRSVYHRFSSNQNCYIHTVILQSVHCIKWHLTNNHYGILGEVFKENENMKQNRQSGTSA